MIHVLVEVVRSINSVVENNIHSLTIQFYKIIQGGHQNFKGFGAYLYI